MLNSYRQLPLIHYAVICTNADMKSMFLLCQIPVNYIPFSL